MDARAYSQVSYIINSMSQNLKSKIPISIINLIETNKDKNYKITGKIENMELLDDTKKILCCIYTDYIAAEEEKEIIRKKENLVYWQQEKEKGKYQNLFNKKG